MTHLPETAPAPQLTGSTTLSALDSPLVIAERLALVAAAVEAPVRLGTFTDEEVAALDDLSITPAQPSPWFASLAEEDKQVALTAALRGLTARGVFAAKQVPGADRTYTAYLDPTLGAMLTLRRHVPYVVVAERTSDEFVDWALFYPQRGGVFLAEYVEARGLHAFEVADTEATVETLAQWVGHFDADCPELDLTLTRSQIATQPAALTEVSETLVAVTLTRVVPGQPGQDAWSTVYTGPGGCYLALEIGDGDCVQYRGIDSHDLATHLRKALT